jgi:hypothetical protein
MTQLSNKNWKAFDIENIFPILHRGVRLRGIDRKPGNFRFISATTKDHGIVDLIEVPSGIEIFSHCLTLTISGTTAGVFYHPYPFVPSDRVIVMKSDQFSKNVYLFLAVAVQKSTQSRDFTKEINNRRLRNLKINLPVNDEEKPDFLFMEQFIESRISAKRQKYFITAY